MVLAARYKPMAEFLRSSDSIYLPWPVVGVGAMVLAAGMWLLWTSRSRESATA